MTSLENLRFDNTYLRLPEIFYRRVNPTPLPAPYLVSFNPAAAELIGLDSREAARPEFVGYFTGNELLPGSEPISAIYAGHQFAFGVVFLDVSGEFFLLFGQLLLREQRN